MPTSFEHLAAELRYFDSRREIVNAMRKGLRSSAGPARKRIKAAAKEWLPKEGGLAAWVAKLSVTAAVRVTGRKAGVTLKGGRNSQGARSDIRAIDAGRVRHPEWGRRYSGAWHLQTVRPGFFTETAATDAGWADGVDREVDQALNKLRRG